MTTVIPAHPGWWARKAGTIPWSSVVAWEVITISGGERRAMPVAVNDIPVGVKCELTYSPSYPRDGDSS